MEVSDEMVEALFGALGFDKAQPNGSDAVTRAVLGNALRVALAVMPDQYRAGWIAGRDAAAFEAYIWQGLKGRAVAEKIRNMDPPA